MEEDVPRGMVLRGYGEGGDGPGKIHHEVSETYLGLAVDLP